MSDVKKMAAEFKITGANEAGEFQAKNAKAVYEANLPEGITPETAKAVGDYNKVFHKSLLEAALEPMVTHLKATPALGLAQLEASVAGVKYGVSAARTETGVEMRGFANLAVGGNMMTATARASKLWSN